MAKYRVPNTLGFEWQKPVLDKDLTAPPSSPSNGDRYIVASGATGDWSGHDGEIAWYENGVWYFILKKEGMITYVKDENLFYRCNGSAWTYAWSVLDNYWHVNNGNLYTDVNVGIGTTNPSKKLEVNGGLKVTGDWYWYPFKNFLLFPSVDNSEWSFDLKNQDSYSGCYWHVWSDKDGGHSILVARGDTLKVGIGTTSPSEKLEVNGNIKTTGDIKLGNWSLGSTKWPGVGGFEYSGSDVTFGISSAGGSQASLQIDGAFIQTETGKTNQFLNRTIVGKEANHAVDGMGLLVVKGGQTSDTKPLGLITLQNLWTDSGLYRNSIGIEFFCGDGNPTSNLNGSRVSAIYSTTADGIDGTIMFWSKHSDGTFVENMRITNNGNVGIGTTSPQHKLEVNGDVYFGSYSKSTNGYTKMPNGLILQWGSIERHSSDNDITVTYPITFPNAVLAVLISSDSIGSGTPDGRVSRTRNITVTGFYSVIDSFNSNRCSNYNEKWIAIGY